MRLTTSTSLEETAEQFWRLRTLAGRLARPLASLVARRRTLAAYEALPQRILEDIGLPKRSVVRARADGTSLAEAARRERAAERLAAGTIDPFVARMPFARPRRPVPPIAQETAAGDSDRLAA